MIHLQERYTGAWTVCGDTEAYGTEITERLSETTCPRCFHDGDPVPRTRKLTVDRAHAEALAMDEAKDAEAQVEAWRERHGSLPRTYPYWMIDAREADHAEALNENLSRSNRAVIAGWTESARRTPLSPAEAVAAQPEAVDLYDARERKLAAAREIRDAVRRELTGKIVMGRVGTLLTCERAALDAQDLTITYRHAGHDEPQTITLSPGTSYATVAALILVVA